MMIRPLHSVVWNLFLALIPVVLALVIYFGIRRERAAGHIQWALWAPVLAVWLAFLPNSCYLVTEWRHYVDELMRNPDIYWQAKHSGLLMIYFLSSSVFYVCYSASGLICFYLSIYPLDILFAPHWALRPFFFFLCSLGVYLGLVDRFNSWQIIRHPHEILHAAHEAVERPVLLLLLCGFSIVLWAFYSLFGLTMDGVRLRYRQVRPA